MQSVPQEWIDKQSQPILPLSDLLITFDIVDYDINNKLSTVSMTNADAIADADEVINESRNIANFYTLDNGGLILDGSGNVIDTNTNTGYITSDICNSSGVFGNTSSYIINFSSVITKTMPLITIQWSKVYNQKAKDFTIKFYNGATLVSTKAVQDNEDIVSVVLVNATGFNKIEVIIDKWCIPNSRGRIEQIVLGQRLNLTKNNIIKYSCDMEIDLNSFYLPTHKISFEIDNSQDQFNPDNPSGIYSYLDEKQEVRVLYGLKLSGGMTYINGGKYYITEWKVPQNSINATFYAGSLLDFMDVDFDITQVGTIPVTTTLATLIASAFTQCNIDASDYVIDSDLSNISCTIDTEIGYKCREIVQLCANAGECIIRVDRNGVINIEKFDINSLTDSGYEITRFVAYKNADYNNTSSLKSVVVNDNLGYYSTGNTKGEVQTIQNPLIQTQNRANSVAHWIANVLLYNKRLDGEWRADTRLDVIDAIQVYNKYANSIPLVVTMINYSFNGIFRGKYEGRITQ